VLVDRRKPPRTQHRERATLPAPPRGVVSSIVDQTVVIANSSSQLTVDLTKFDEFEYADVREAPPEVKTAGKLGACLTIKSAVTMWRFYERADFGSVTLL
jgi:hypothetical protein